MRAILASLGTDGDILPFIGLGVTLRARGHRVTLAAAENYAEAAAEHGLDFRQLVSAARMRELFSNPDCWHPIKTAPLCAKWGAGLIAHQYKIFEEFAAREESVFICNPAVFAASIAAEKFSRPIATLVLQPWMLPSAIAPAAMPMVGLPKWAPPFVHRILFRLIDVVGDTFIGPKLNSLRRSLGLKPARRILTNWFSPQLILGMFPDWFGPMQPDWPRQTKLLNFPRFDGATQRTLPGKVRDFVTRDRPTALFTFGSGMMHAKPLIEAAERICAQLKIQGLLLNRFHAPHNLPPHMMHAPFLPFREIFPHCAAVFHHGGIGTTAEALACGTPQLIIPLGFDQLDNAVRVAKLNAGLHTRSKHNLVSRSPSNSDLHEISTLLERLLTGEFQKSSAALAQRFLSENPLERAADHIESLALCDSPRTR